MRPARLRKRVPLSSAAAGCLCALHLFAAQRGFLPYASVKAILPAELHITDEKQWLEWRQTQDKAIRARLDQGDLDSLVNLLLLGTSFTKQPRIPMDRITQASKAGTLRARINDMVAGLRDPGSNERLAFVQALLRRHGIDPSGSHDRSQPGVFLYNNLLRAVKERISLGERVAEAERLQRPDNPASLLNRSAVFQDRGISLDTGILPDFLIEQTLADLKQRGILRESEIRRVAVIGPGVDFIDKNESYAYDYYPQQTRQPFALYDSLLRLRLAPAGALSLSVLDISSRVIDHIRRARERPANSGYVVQLPHDSERPWPPELNAYWNSWGDRVGTELPPIPPPEIFKTIHTRAVRIRPEVVRAIDAENVNVVLEHLALSEAARFDLIVGTNIFIYYDEFQQSLALENAGAMLKRGGLLLTNDRLPETADGTMRLAGITLIGSSSSGAATPLAVGWYTRKN